MVTWEKRHEEADKQRKDYTKKTAIEKKENEGIVTNLIEKWLVDSGLCTIISMPQRIDLRKLNEAVIERDITEKTAKAVKITNAEVKKIERQIWTNAFGGTNESACSMHEIRDSTKHFLWVTFKNDGMVVTVGKTNMKNNDLLKYNDVYNSGTGDTRIKLQQLLTPADMKVLDELNIRMHRYSEFALVLGVNLTVNDEKDGTIYQVKSSATKSVSIQLTSENNEKLNAFVKKLETQLGEFLIHNKIHILNRYSHNQ